MNISMGGVLAILGCLLVALLPLPRRAEGLRIGFFGALMAFVFYDASRADGDADFLDDLDLDLD